MHGSESPSVLSNSLWPHGRPWNSLGQNTGVGSFSLLQWIFPTQGSNPDLPHCRWILYQLSTREAQEYWSGLQSPSPADLPDAGTEPESPALHADSLPTELSGKPPFQFRFISSSFFFFSLLQLWLWLPKLCWIKLMKVDIFVLFSILEEMLSAFHHWVWWHIRPKGLNC